MPYLHLQYLCLPFLCICLSVSIHSAFSRVCLCKGGAACCCVSTHQQNQLSYLRLQTTAHEASEIIGRKQSYNIFRLTTETSCSPQREPGVQVALCSHVNMLQGLQLLLWRHLNASVSDEKWEHMPLLLHGKIESKETAGQGDPRTERCRGDSLAQVLCEGYFLYLFPAEITKQAKS